MDYDVQLNTKIDYTNNHVFRSMTMQDLHTFHTVCELARNQLLTMSVQNPQLAGFLTGILTGFLTGHRSNFFHVESSTAWLYYCPQFLSFLYKADSCFNRKPINFKDILM